MNRGRMEAFSDGVLAIIITIMVLELKTPSHTNIASIREIMPTLVAYVLSYIYIGIYWVNHHYLLNSIDKINGSLLWKNLHWLFWMSLIPIATEWMGTNPFTKYPALFYGIILFMCSVSYYLLESSILNKKNNKMGKDKKFGIHLKTEVSIVLYAIAMGMALFIPSISYMIYGLIAMFWFIPEVNIENFFKFIQKD